MAHDVFISHSSQDKGVAQALCEGLERSGVRCWMAPRDVSPSRPYAEECVRGIEEGATFLLLASESAVTSVQVLSEVEQAHKRRKPIYTILTGKPKVTKELDYYISRLHWIEYAGGSLEKLTEQLFTVLSGRQQWSDVAAPPSLRRTILYRRDAFMGSVLGTLLALIIAATGFAYWEYQNEARLDQDYRRVGYVRLSVVPSRAMDTPEPMLRLQAQVWVLAKDVPFGDVELFTAEQKGDGAVERSNRSAFTNPQQVGSVEFVNFVISSETKYLTTCLLVPASGRKGRSRVTQAFSLSVMTNEAVDIVPIAEPEVTKEDGTPCGVAHTGSWAGGASWLRRSPQ